MRSEFYDVAGFKAGRSALKGVDVDAVGDVRGKKLLHLQCHFGLDTLSWARLGAAVTGLDFSPEAIAAARALARETGLAARFVCSDVYDAPAALGERFDVVYTGVGALCWLPDVARWADVVAALLAPGGLLYLRECHPVLHALDESSDPAAPRLAYPYFEAEATRFEVGGTYADPKARVANATTYQWNHGIGEVVTALVTAGLAIEALHEHRGCDWQALPQMARGPDGMWRLPEHGEMLPLMYSIRAVLRAA